MVVVRLRNEDTKRKIMKRKKKLADRIEQDEDLTWKERKTKWLLKGVTVKLDQSR